MKQYSGDYQKYMKQGAQGGKESNGGDYQQYMKQYAGDYQKYMKQGAQGKNESHGGDYQQYMKQYAGDYQKYMNQGGDHQQYMKQYSGDYQKYMKQGAQGKSNPSSSIQSGSARGFLDASQAPQAQEVASVSMTGQSPSSLPFVAPTFLMVFGVGVACFVGKRRKVVAPNGYVSLVA